MNFKTIKITAFRSTITPVFLSPDNFTIVNTDIVAYCNWKTIDTVSTVYVKTLNDMSGVKEEFTEKLPNMVHPSVETAFAEHFRYQTGTSNKSTFRCSLQNTGLLSKLL